MKITTNIAKKVLETVDAGLSNGLGKPEPGQMCVEAAVCYALGLPHGDEPGCVSASVRKFKIRLNDSSWSTNEARAKGLRRLALAQLGSKNILNETEFAIRCALIVYKEENFIKWALRWLSNEDRLEAAAARSAARAAVAARSAARSAVAARSAARAAAWSAAAAAARAAAEAARSAVAAARSAARAAAWSARSAAARAAAAAAAEAARSAAARSGDKVLSDFAEQVVQILIEMKAPGCQWLYLTE